METSEDVRDAPASALGYGPRGSLEHPCESSHEGPSCRWGGERQQTKTSLHVVLAGLIALLAHGVAPAYRAGLALSLFRGGAAFGDARAPPLEVDEAAPPSAPGADVEPGRRGGAGRG